MNRMKLSAALALTLGIILPSSACAAEATLRVAYDAANTTLDPIATTQNVDIRLITNINAYLIRLADDGSGLVPDLAESWTVSDDGQVYRFELGDAVFSNGEPVTTDDVVFSIERLRDNPMSVQAPLYSLIRQVTAVDEDTVEIVLDAASPATLSALAMYPAAILPADLGGMADNEFGAAPISAGPFMVESWERGGELVIVANPHYFDADSIALDRIEWNPVPDDNSRLLQLLGGQVDVALPVPLNVIESLRTREDVEVVLSPSTLTYALIFNYEHEPFGDRRVREAIALALDLDRIAQVITFGLGGRSNSVLAEGTLYYDPTVPLRPYDLERAKALLEEAGLAGAAIELSIPIGNSLLEQFSVIAQQQLGEAGLQVTVRRLEETQYWTSFEAGDYQLAVGDWTNDMAHPDQKMSFTLGGGDSLNYFSRYRNPEIEAMVAEARTIADEDAARAAYSRIQHAAYEDVFWVDLFKLPFVAAVSTRVQGFSQDISGRINFEDLSVN